MLLHSMEMREKVKRAFGDSAMGTIQASSSSSSSSSRIGRREISVEDCERRTDENALTVHTESSA